MKDPRVHVERGFAMMPDAHMRAAFTAAAGLAGDAPKTVTTGCRRRRLYVMTRTSPSSVTCPACREFAAGQHEDLAAAGAVISLAALIPARRRRSRHAPAASARWSFSPSSTAARPPRSAGRSP